MLTPALDSLTIIIVILNSDPFAVALIVKLPVLDPIGIVIPAVVASFKRQRPRRRHGHAELSTPNPELIIVIVVELVGLVVVIAKIDVECLPANAGIIQCEGIRTESQETLFGGFRETNLHADGRACGRFAEDG